MSPDPPIQFRNEKIAAGLHDRANPGESLGLVASRELTRYYYLLDQALHATPLTRGEASAIADVCNGWWTDDLIDRPSYEYLWAELDDGCRLNGLDEKWGIDRHAFVARIRDLPSLHRAALVDAAARFWAAVSGDRDPQINDFFNLTEDAGGYSP